MNTQIMQYEGGTSGYTAIVEDFKELFHWDGFLESAETKNPSIKFKMAGEGDREVGLQITAGSSSSYGSNVVAYVYNGSSTYTSSTSSQTFKNVAYAYGDGFFVACGGNSGFPSAEGVTVGVVRSRSMLTGETEYCSFMVDVSGYYFYAQSTMSGSGRDLRLVTNASVGAAISLHDPALSLVADTILLLTAIPDTINSGLSKVMFNGTPYMRLGRILIPAE